MNAFEFSNNFVDDDYYISRIGIMIAEGVDVYTVSKRLGHANTSTTLNIYAHALKSRDAEAAKKLENIFSNTI